MNNFTFILPVRVDSAYREANIKAICDFYSRDRSFKISIVEADSIPRLKNLLSNYRTVDYTFIEDKETVFHRTKYINIMMRNTSDQYAAIWDADVIAPIQQIIDAYSKLRQYQEIMVYPYDGKFWDVGENISELFKRNLDINFLETFPYPRTLMNGYNSVGGAFLVNIEKYREVGWENENFIGWGPEDEERYHRLDILGHTPKRIKGNLYHLFHPRGINSGYFDSKVAFHTKREYCKICSLTKTELTDYINQWSWIHL